MAFGMPVATCVHRPPEARAVVLAGPCPPGQNCGVPTLTPYPFRFLHPLTGESVRTRHEMLVPAEWIVVGPMATLDSLTRGPGADNVNWLV